MVRFRFSSLAIPAFYLWVCRRKVEPQTLSPRSCCLGHVRLFTVTVTGQPASPLKTADLSGRNIWPRGATTFVNPSFKVQCVCCARWDRLNRLCMFSVISPVCFMNMQDCCLVQKSEPPVANRQLREGCLSRMCSRMVRVCSGMESSAG